MSNIDVPDLIKSSLNAQQLANWRRALAEIYGPENVVGCSPTDLRSIPNRPKGPPKRTNVEQIKTRDYYRTRSDTKPLLRQALARRKEFSTLELAIIVYLLTEENPPGWKISIAHLAKSLDADKPAISKAIKRLAAANIVANIGTRKEYNLIVTKPGAGWRTLELRNNRRKGSNFKKIRK